MCSNLDKEYPQGCFIISSSLVCLNPIPSLLTVFLFSYASTEELEAKALHLMQEARKKPAVVGFLVPDPGESQRKWGEKKEINKKVSC